MNYSYIIYTKNELFIYIYIHKTDLIHTKKLFIQKKELFIYKKKVFIVIIIYKTVSCTKMLYIYITKMSYSYKNIFIHTKKEVIHTQNELFIQTKTKMSYSYKQKQKMSYSYKKS